MAQILDRDAQTVLVKITMNEYKKLENMDFFSQKESTEDNWETMVDFGDGVPATEVASYLKSLK
ncbi:MAG: hypothetical protein PHN60_01160 [Candidatus Gracilibacteria bacterium]|nr:hypothetical protein [Candidatus Gracilibacteria bacterium]